MNTTVNVGYRFQVNPLSMHKSYFDLGATETILTYAYRSMLQDRKYGPNRLGVDTVTKNLIIELHSTLEL